MERISRKAQSIVEYLVILIVIVGIFVIAGSYYKRGLQGKYKQAGDTFGGGEQYTP